MLDLIVNSTSPVDDGDRDYPRLHVVDRAIHDIANDYRFTVEEVREFYDKCGDIERVKAKFRKMREALNALRDDDTA